MTVQLTTIVRCGRDDFGDSLSGCWLLYARVRSMLLGMLPMAMWRCIRCRHSPGPVPVAPRIMSMGEISGELAFVMAAQRARETSHDIDLLLVPPVQEYRTLDFHKADEIVEKGYSYASAQLKHWRAYLRGAANETGSSGTYSDRRSVRAFKTSTKKRGAPARRTSEDRRLDYNHSRPVATEVHEGASSGDQTTYAATGWRGASCHRVLSNYMVRQASGQT